jgi:hypothetical protein
MRQPATHTLQDELEDLAGKIRDAAPSLARPSVAAEGLHLAVRLDAAAGENGFTVTITVTTPAGYPARLEDGITPALEVDGRYFIAVPTPDGAAVFRSVPGGEWNPWWIRGRRTRAGEDPSFALPLPRQQAELAAASERSGTALMSVVLPDARGTLTLHRERDRSYLVEFDLGAGTDHLVVVTVRFGKEDGREGLVVIPVRRSALARLDGFSPIAPWQASLVTGTQLSALPAVDIIDVASSVRAAASNATRRAWYALGDMMPEIRQVIEQELGADAPRPGRDR